MTTVGLIPAAGYATRLAGSIVGSKEVQSLRGRPAMAYLVDRCRLGGAERVVVATRPDKVDVIALAGSLGADVVTGQPPSVSASLLLAARALDDDAIGLFGFPDTVWSPSTGFASVRALVVAGAPLALGVFASPYPARSDVVTLDDAGWVADVEVKPDRPSSTLVWAMGAGRVGFLRTILAEREPGEAFRRLAQQAPVPAVRLGRVIDIGTPEALVEAATDPVWDE